MHRNLTIDCGNSAVKIVLFQDDTIIDAVAVPYDDDPQKAIFDMAVRYQAQDAICCSVARDSEPYCNTLHQAGVKRVIDFDWTINVPLINDYATPRTLGADRMAAAVGAASVMPATELLVVDLGSACTYDLVTASGHFAGGNIAPGVGMRLRSLNAFTARLPLVDPRGPLVDFGTDTAMALRTGAVRGVAAEIQYYRTLGASSPRPVVMTGGWASSIHRIIASDDSIILKPYLVNQGLNSILRYNGNENN